MKNKKDKVNQNAEADQYSKDLRLATNESELQKECYCGAFSEYFHSLVEATIPESESDVGKVFGFDFKAKAVEVFLDDAIKKEVKHIIEGERPGHGGPKSYHSRFCLSHYGNCSTAYMCKLKHDLSEAGRLSCPSRHKESASPQAG